MTGCVGALSAFYHDFTDISDPVQRMIASIRMIAKMPTMAAMAYKYSVGQPFIYPKNDLDYATNFLRMCFAVPCEDYKPNAVLARAMDRIFILHADHEQMRRPPPSVSLAPPAPIHSPASPRAAPACGARSWRRERSRVEHADSYRHARPNSGIHSPCQGPERQLSVDGFWASGLQTLRPSRQDHAENMS